MRALILAAGRGERMRPLTEHCPKPLLQVRGSALIDHHLRALARAGIAEVVINLSYLGSMIEAHVRDGAQFGLRVQYSHEGVDPLETGGGIKHALPLLGTGPFLVLNGDVFLDADLADFCARPCPGLAHLLMVPNPSFHPEGDFVLGPACAGTTGAVRRLRTCGGATSTYAGVGLYRAALVANEARTHFKLAPLLREAMQLGQVTGELFAGLWSDVGTPERLRELA